MTASIKEEGNFPSSDKKHNISYMIISPEKPRAVLQFCHGMAEHKNRYIDFGTFLAENGIAFAMHDHLGHGDSVSSDDELGFFADRDGWRYLPADAHSFTEILREKFPEIPFFIGGHSMGSFVARAYLRLYGDDKLSGGIIMGTGDSSPTAKIGVYAAKAIGLFRGRHYRSRLLDKLSFGSYNAAFGETKTASDWLSRDEQSVRKYIDDPRCGFIFTASAFADVASLIGFATGRKWAQTLNKGCPLLVISGEADPVGGNGKGVSAVYSQIKEAGVADAELKLYPGARHEILNETNREEVRRDILNWLNARIN